MAYHMDVKSDGQQQQQQQQPKQQQQQPKKQQQQQLEQQQQQQPEQQQHANSIVEVNLDALPGEYILQSTGEEYVGKFHIHQDGTIMAGVGVLGETHDIIPEKVIVQQPLEEQIEDITVDDYYGLGLPEFPTLTIAPSIDSTGFIVPKLYGWLVERVPNITNFLTVFSNLLNNYNGAIAGGYLRRVIQSGDAFQFQNADIDFWFSTVDNLSGAVNFINQGHLTEFHQPELQEIQPDKLLYSWDLVSKTSEIPNVKLQIISRLVGNIENILSHFDFTNAKIATNLNQVIIDSRWENFESNRIVNIDMLKPPVLWRLLKYLHGEGEPFKLNGPSAFKFLTWVGPRVSYSPYMQQLYDALLNANEVNYETISFIEPYLNELNLPTGELPPVNLPLNVSLV